MNKEENKIRIRVMPPTTKDNKYRKINRRSHRQVIGTGESYIDYANFNTVATPSGHFYLVASCGYSLKMLLSQET